MLFKETHFKYKDAHRLKANAVLTLIGRKAYLKRFQAEHIYIQESYQE